MATPEHYLPVLPLVLILLAGSPRAVRVEVQLARDSALIVATFEDSAGSTFEVLPLRALPGQRIEPLDAPQGTVRYVVRGARSRIPLPVPVGPLPRDGGVTIVVRGLRPGVDLGRAFPRLHGESDGTASATLANMPALLHLPPETGAWTLTRAVEWFLAVLAVLAGTTWARRAVRPEPEVRS